MGDSGNARNAKKYIFYIKEYFLLMSIFFIVSMTFKQHHHAQRWAYLATGESGYGYEAGG
ncbi:hypothetical protein [Serratia marcescens]|uniref:hypothetical protein n=1 Tax=Serratia marcescens TaxID=615 RepID=UPI0013DD5427|nr:hypothetical protein [Serratia marcescens]